MVNKRPVELNKHIENQSEQNDLLIANALEKLENPDNWEKLKPTVSTICKLTKLSRNSIRNREWALNRLKSIKQKRKDSKALGDISSSEEEHIDSPPLVDQLRSRIKSLLEQNFLLYEEVISLKESIKRKDLEIKTLRPTKIY